MDTPDKAESPTTVTRPSDSPTRRDTVGHDEEKGCVTFLRSLDGRRKWILLYIGCMELANFGSLALIGPFFPEEAKRAGMSVSVTGYVVSFSSIAVAIGSPFWGKMLPKIRPRNTVLIGGFLMGIANVAFGLVLEYVHDLTTFTALCFLLRLCLGCGMAAVETGYFSTISDNFYDSIGTAMGIHEIFIGIGLSTGPILGGVLDVLGGVCAAYGFYGSLIVAGTFGAYFVFPDMPTTGSNKSTTTGSMKKLLFEPTSWVVSLVIIGGGILWMSLSPTLEPHLRTLHVKEGQMVLIFTLKSAAYSLSCPLVGYVSDKFGKVWRIMVFGMCTFAIAFLLLGPSSMILPFIENSLWLTIFSLILTGFSQAATVVPSIQAMMDAAVQDCGMPRAMSTFGIVSGLWLMVISLGEAAGPSIGGILVEQYGFPDATTTLALCILPLAVIVAIFFIWKKQYAKQISDAESNVVE